MTYCVGVILDAGLVMASDTRTNAGVDHVAVFKKMKVFEKAGDRVIVIVCSGNLSITQSVYTLLQERGQDENLLNVWNAQSMTQVTALVGNTLREVQDRDGPYLAKHNIEASANFIVGGQIRGEDPRLFLVYPEGNSIEAMPDTPYFQVGETKYGKPIIDRVVQSGTSLTEAGKCLIVSFDSTMRSNISVGLPIDMVVYQRDSLKVAFQWRITDTDPYFEMIHREWGKGLRQVFQQLSDPDWKL